MRRVLGSLIAICVISAAIPLAPRTAEASLVADAVEMCILVGEVVVLWQLQKAITKARGEIEELTEHLHNRNIHEMQFDMTMYMQDHRALPLGLRVNPLSAASDLTGLYSGLSGAGGVSFKSGALTEADAREFITGRASADPRRADFPEDYRERAGRLKRYADGVVGGINRDLDALILYQKDIKSMDIALRSEVAAGNLADVWESEFEQLEDYESVLPFDEADPEEFNEYYWGEDGGDAMLPESVLTGPGYRWTVQASGQMANFRNHIMTRVRAGTARQIEAEAKFAANEQAERSGAHFAFERAVETSWSGSVPSTGSGY
jgi:hypothetical protein